MHVKGQDHWCGLWKVVLQFVTNPDLHVVPRCRYLVISPNNGLRGVEHDAHKSHLPLQLGELLEDRANAFAPFFTQGRKVDIPLIETPTHVQLQAIPFVTHEINGHADG